MTWQEAAAEGKEAGAPAEPEDAGRLLTARPTDVDPGGLRRHPAALHGSGSADPAARCAFLPRGNWMDESGEVVKPALPHYLPQPKVEGRDLTRLDLAQWLVSRDNPLTARVVREPAVEAILRHRLEQDARRSRRPGRVARRTPHCSTGWPASSWTAAGTSSTWCALIVTSQTYRQASTATPELLAPRPVQSRTRPAKPLPARCRARARQRADDRRPARGEDRRPERQAVSARRLLGEPELPGAPYEADPGESQYRRGLYTWWQRTFLHPSLLAFDAPTREECCCRAQPLEHSAAGPGPAERSDLRRGRPRLRRADSQRMLGPAVRTG